MKAFFKGVSPVLCVQGSIESPAEFMGTEHLLPPVTPAIHTRLFGGGNSTREDEVSQEDEVSLLLYPYLFGCIWWQYKMFLIKFYVFFEMCRLFLWIWLIGYRVGRREINGLGGKESIGSIQQLYGGETAEGDSTLLLGQWFPNLREHQHHLEVLLNYRLLGCTPRASRVRPDRLCF